MQADKRCSAATWKHSRRGALALRRRAAPAAISRNPAAAWSRTLTTGSARTSRLPWLVWRITLDSRRAMLWAVRRSVSANTTTTDPSSWAAPKSICRIRRLMIRAPSSCARGCSGSNAKRATDSPLPRDCGLIDGGGEIAAEGGRGQQAGSGSSRPPASIARSVRLKCASSACWRISGRALAAM